jgi:hypothetical protein
MFFLLAAVSQLGLRSLEFFSSSEVHLVRALAIVIAFVLSLQVHPSWDSYTYDRFFFCLQLHPSWDSCTCNFFCFELAGASQLGLFSLYIIYLVAMS